MSMELNKIDSELYTKARGDVLIGNEKVGIGISEIRIRCHWLEENPDNRIISGYIIFQHEIHNLDRNKNLQFEAATESDQWKIFRINDLRSTTFDNEIRISKIEFENEPVEIIE
jgi:hypothetical protein